MSRPAALAVVALLLAAGVAPAVTAGPTTPEGVTAPAATASEPAPSNANTPESSANATDSNATDSSVDATDSNATDSSMPSASASMAPEDNTTRRLGLDGATVGNYTSVSLDFAGSMAFSAERVASEYRTTLVTVQLEQVQSTEARTAIVDAYLDGVVAEIDEIEAEQTAAIRAYHAGEIDAQTLLVRLAVVDMRARALEESMRRVQTASSPIGIPTDNRLQAITVELDSYESRIRSHVATAVTGELKTGVNEIHVTTSTDGLVVEMLTDRRYYRNAYRADNREPDAVDQFDRNIRVFRDRVRELYPWSTQGSIQRNSQVDTFVARNVYRTTYSHPQGSMAIYVDGGTRDVFREEQSLVLDRLPRAPSVGSQTANLSVSVTPTTAGSPVLVNVTRPASGNASATPLDAVVRVNGQTMGRTGDDGELWLIAPAGDYRVSVGHDGTTINVSVPN
jgi:hypothetical protein